MPLRFHPLRFGFVAREPIYFPPGKSANILRGALGSIFRRIACVPECVAAKSCQRRAACPYAQIFEPSAAPGAPSGLRDLPRPFVFRAWHLDGKTIPAGGAFHFDLNLFETRAAAIEYLVRAFARFGREGLGPARRRVDLNEVWQVALDGKRLTKLYDGMNVLLQLEPAELDLTAPDELIDNVRLAFVTPTELKAEDGVAGKPEFGTLAARLRDRLSTLSELYGDGPLGIDFRAFGERARLIRMTDCKLRHIDVERRSSRSGQVHSIGGFVGEAGYEGECQGMLSEFVPYLRAAKWTGVGRQTVWGKGEIDIISASRQPLGHLALMRVGECDSLPDWPGPVD